MKKEFPSRVIAKSEKVCTGRTVAKALAEVKLTPKQARAWQRDRAKARRALRAAAVRW